MAKTIQVRVDDELKDAADTLFTSLGLDTSTAVRMFLVTSTETGGIPFVIGRSADRDTAIRAAIASKRAGEHFYTAEESLANMQAAMKTGKRYRAVFEIIDNNVYVYDIQDCRQDTDKSLVD